MADTNSIIRRYKSTLSDLGRAALHALYPRDFEYYLVSLELTELSEEGENTIDYFVFPIAPNSINKSENNRINVKKTATSNVVINNKHFTPHDLTLKGDFGRGFKILISPNETISFKGLRYSIKEGNYNPSDLLESTVNDIKAEFNPEIKTGYGCIKILQSIVSKAMSVDKKGNPFRLYFYNPALGESYLVVPKPNGLNLQQDQNQNNMIWSYSLNFTIIADIVSSRNKTIKRSLSSLLSAGAIQKGVNEVGRDISNFITSSI